MEEVANQNTPNIDQLAQAVIEHAQKQARLKLLPYVEGIKPLTKYFMRDNGDTYAALSLADKEFLDELMPEQVTEPKFSDYKVIITDEFTMPEPIVKQGDRTIVSRGNIVAIIGKPKAFKTFLISAIAAGFLEDTVLSISGCGGRCLIIDTEQAKSHVNIVQKRIYRLCGWDLNTPNESLIMLSLRELDAENRLKLTLEAISELKPDLVVIDGIRDLVKDFNDLAESAEIVGTLMAISTNQNCGVVTILHQNKNDNNARGHLGSELCNKSETVLQVVNINGIATVEPVYSRNREISSFSFRIDDTGLPVGCELPKVEAKSEELKELMRKAMFGSSWVSRKDLTTRVATLIGRTERTAERKIKEAIDKEILTINSVGSLVLKSQPMPPSEPLF